MRPDGLPDIAWSKDVPTGVYKIAVDAEVGDSLPPQEITLKYCYRLGKYPVTVAQFQAFLDDETLVLSRIIGGMTSLMRSKSRK